MYNFNPTKTNPFSRKSCVSLAALAFLTLLIGSAVAEPIRVQDDEVRKSAIQKSQPVYPPIARQMNLSGRVLVDAIVSETGSVEKVDIVTGNPILAAAAQNAAKNWKFQPFQVNGKATEAVVRLAFDFSR